MKNLFQNFKINKAINIVFLFIAIVLVVVIVKGDDFSFVTSAASEIKPVGQIRYRIEYVNKSGAYNTGHNIPRCSCDIDNSIEDCLTSYTQNNSFTTTKDNREEQCWDQAFGSIGNYSRKYTAVNFEVIPVASIVKRLIVDGNLFVNIGKNISAISTALTVPNGFVGIGTSNPQRVFEVSGDAKFCVGDLCANLATRVNNISQYGGWNTIYYATTYYSEKVPGERAGAVYYNKSEGLYGITERCTDQEPDGKDIENRISTRITLNSNRWDLQKAMYDSYPTGVVPYNCSGAERTCIDVVYPADQDHGELCGRRTLRYYLSIGDGDFSADTNTAQACVRVVYCRYSNSLYWEFDQVKVENPD